jgi:2-dehydro-3-deoxyglucarate aldolase
VGDEFTIANEEILTAVQIEHIEGVQNIHDILSVPGIDAVFIGPYDLTASMGITAQFDHPEYLKARDRILRACQEHGVVPGIHVVQPNTDELLARAHDGYRFLAYSLDITMLLHTCAAGVAKLKGFLARRELESAGARHTSQD